MDIVWKVPNYVRYVSYKLLRNGSLQNLSELKKLEHMSSTDIKNLQQEKVIELLKHAYNTTPYYHKLFNKYNIISNNEVDIGKIQAIPPLEKEILREKKEELISSVANSRKIVWNSSGGSTGEPVQFLQDSIYNDWSRATKIWFNEWTGTKIGDKHIQFWGSERDLFEGNIGFKAKLTNWILNRKLLNSFRMGKEEMNKYVNIINSYQPVQILAYAESIYELARYVEQEGLSIHSPRAIMTSASTLYPYMRDTIEKVFQSPVYNRYGSREVSDMACECSEQKGLHISALTHLIEVVHPDGTPCLPGEEGEVLVTSLTNYVMPLIRYRIGDTAIYTSETCSCGMKLPLLKQVTGRTVERIFKADGTSISPLYFIHLIGVVLNKGEINKFRVIQENIDEIYIILVPSQTIKQELLDEIKNKVLIVMGSSCKVSFKVVEDIEPSPSGKYNCVISKVKN